MKKTLKRLSLSELIAAVVAQVEDSTGLRCVTDANNEPSPFYSIGAVVTRPDKSKTMYLDVFTLQIHAISKPGETREEVFSMLDALSEAMSVRVELACPYRVVRQVDDGVQTIKRDETGEWHAISEFEITVSYGLIIK